MASLWLVLALQISAPPDVSPPIVRATMHDKCIYTSGVVYKEPDIKWTYGGGKLWLQKMDLKEKSKITSLDYIFGINGSQDSLLRWQIYKGQYYCVAYSWAGDSLSLSRLGTINAVPLSAIESVNANGKAADLLDRREKYGKVIEAGPGLGGAIGKSLHIGQGGTFYLGAFFDFWCPEEKQLEVYVNLNEPLPAEDGAFRNALPKDKRLIRADFHPERKRRPDQDPKLQWDTVGEWTYDWEGPFYVTATGDDRNFVTDTGRVFAAPRGAKAGTPLKQLWKGKPVDALIHDADNKKWYAFTKDEYFEVSDPIKPKPHTIDIRRSKIANEALETAAKCGRVIRGLPEPKGK